jgi:hypothetical protein
MSTKHIVETTWGNAIIFFSFFFLQIFTMLRQMGASQEGF